MDETRKKTIKTLITRFFSSENLTKKATLNALASGLDYATKMVVGFIITPMMVSGLGDYFYGVWQIVNRLFSYISIINGVSSPLELTLTKEQTVENDEQKRRYIGSTLVVWAFFLPITGIFSGIITWQLPFWLNAPVENYFQIRMVALIFGLAVGSASLAYMPYGILVSQNQAYRRIGLSVLVFSFNGLLAWLALYFKTGIVGLAISYFFQDLISGYFYLTVCQKYINWFGIWKPTLNLVKHFLRLSWWYLASDVISNMIFASDVVVLGLLGSVESVTAYTLTKYVPEIVIAIIAIIVGGITPGLGGILGTGDFRKASQLRGEIFPLTWLIMVAMETAVLIWNRIFLGLWVGNDRYAGNIPCLLIVIIVIQFVLIRTDGSLINLTLRVERKVFYGALSVIISVVIGGILVKYFQMGIIGVSIGLILGRSILSISYPIIVSRFLGISFISQLKNIVRPATVTAILFALAIILNEKTQSFALSGIVGWIILILGAGGSAVLVLVLAFFAGLSRDQRKKILSRFQMMYSV